jgi:hypothetical protein
MFKPGSVITANGFDYKMLSPNLDAKDSAEDGRRLKLDIAAGLGLSELHVSADASNGNYASLSVAETPAIMTIKSWQRFFMRVYAKIFKFVIETGVQYKLIPPETKRLKRIRKEDGGFEVKLDKFPTSTKANIIPQSVVPRKLKAEVEAYQIMKLNGWLADESAMGLLGIQADKEREIMDYEASLKKDDPEQNDPDDPNGPKGKNNPAYKQKNPPKDKEWDNIEKLREELEEIKDALRQLLGR